MSLALILFLLAAVLLGTAAFAKACVDVMSHQPTNNIFMNMGDWWNINISWKLKYENYDLYGESSPPAFTWFGLSSKTVLVALTDFWHAMDFVYLLTYWLAAFIAGAACVLQWPAGWPVCLAVATVVQKVLFGVVFEYFYEGPLRVIPRTK